MDTQSSASTQVGELSMMKVDDDLAAATDKTLSTRLRLFVFSVLFSICKEVESSTLTTLVFMVIEFFQLTSFAFYDSLSTPFPWNPGTAGLLGNITGYFRLYSIIQGKGGLLRIFFYIIIALLALFVGVAGWVGSELATGRPFKYPIWLRILRTLSDIFFTGIFFIPVVGVLFLQVSCYSSVQDASGDASAILCSSGGFIVGAIFAMLFLLAYLTIAGILAVTYYARLPTAPAVLSRPDGRAHLLQLLIKLVLTAVFIFLRRVYSLQWVLIIILVLGTLWLSYTVSTDMPYFRFGWNMVHACLLFGTFWSAFCCVLVKLVNYPQQSGISLLFYIMLPFVMFCASMLVRIQRAAIERAPVGSLKSAAEVELKARFLMEPVTEELRAALVNNIELALDDSKRDEHAQLLVSALEILEYGTRRFPVAGMFLMRAQYTFAFSKNFSQGLTYLARAEQRSPSFDQKFTCYFYRKQNEETFSNNENNSEVLEYLVFQEALLEARRNDEVATMYQCMFWQELLKTTTDTGRLNSISAELSGAMTKAQTAFSKLMRMKSDSAQVLRMYASFLIEIANENIQGNRLISRADEIEDQRAKSHERGETDASLFDDGNALITISGDVNNVGEIVEVNLPAVRLFGYSRSDLIGENVAMLMPPLFASHHHGFLMRYLDTGESHLLNRARALFGLHRSGWLVPMDAFVREVATPQGMSFLGLIRSPTVAAMGSIVPLQRLVAEQEAQAQAHGNKGSQAGVEDNQRQKAVILAASQSFNISVNFAFVDHSARVVACTAGCSNLFGVSADEVRSGSIELSSWVPDLKDEAKLAEMRSPAGLTTFVTAAHGKRAYMHVMQALMNVGSDSVYLTHLAERPIPAGMNGAAGEESSDDEDEDDDGMGLSDDESVDEEEDDEDEEDDEEEVDEEDEDADGVAKHSDVDAAVASDSDAEPVPPQGVDEDSKSEDTSSERHDDLDLLTGPLPPTIGNMNAATAASSSIELSAAHLPGVIGAVSASLPSSSSSTLPATISPPVGQVVNGVRVLSLNSENLQMHDAAYGNREVPLFDHGEFRRGGAGKKGKKLVEKAGKKGQRKAVKDDGLDAKARAKAQAKIQAAQQAVSLASPLAGAEPAKKKKTFGGFSNMVQIGESAPVMHDEEEEEDVAIGEETEEELGQPLVAPRVQVGRAGGEVELQANPLFVQSALMKPSAGESKPKKSALKTFESSASGASALKQPGGDKKATSVSSKSSGSSRSSASVLHSKLYSFARAREGSELAEGIRNLRLSLFAVLLFVIIIAIVREFVLTGFMNDFVLRLDTLFQAGDRRYLSVRIVLWAHMLLMAELVDASGVYWSNFWTGAQVEPYRKVMENDALQMVQINNVLYLQRRQQLTADHLNLYKAPLVTTYNVQSVSNYYSLQMSLWDSMQSLVNLALSYKDYKIVDIVDTDSTCFWVLRNGVANEVGDLFYVLNRTCLLYQEDSNGSLTAMRTWSYLFLFAGILSVFLVAFLIVRPKVVVVEQNKEAVLLLFGDIPMNLLQAFHQKVSRRLLTLRAALNGEDGVNVSGEMSMAQQDDADADPVAVAAAALGGDATPATTSSRVDIDEENKDGDGEDEGDEKKGEDEGEEEDKKVNSLSKRALLRARKNKKRIMQESSFVLRHLTMLKVSFIVAVTIVYFAVSFMVQFGWLEQKLVVSPSQVNWSQHRRVSLQLLVYDTRHILTQKFWKDFEAGASGIIDVTETDFFRDLNLLTDIEDGLAFGSKRFGTDPPTEFEATQRQLTFRDACSLSKNTADCRGFSHSVLSHGMHAGLQMFVDTARSAYAVINTTLQHPSGTTQATGWVNGSSYNLTAAFVFLDVLNKAFHNQLMTTLKNASEIYLDDSLKLSGELYRDSVSDLVKNYQDARIALLIAFCLLCVGMYVFFYNPMCWTLDAEQKRTSAMLLMIPPDILERIPSIRDFVTKIDVRT